MFHIVEHFGRKDDYETYVRLQRTGTTYNNKFKIALLLFNSERFEYSLNYV